MTEADHTEQPPFDEALTAAYWRYVKRRQFAEHWAYETVDSAMWDHVDGAVTLLVALADSAPDESTSLAVLGAGPLEDFLRRGNRRPTPAELDAIDAAAQTNERFRTALRCVWWGPNDDPDTVTRFQRFGPPL